MTRKPWFLPAVEDSLRLVVEAVNTFLANPVVVAYAQRYAELERAGHELGLTPEQTTEVLTVWARETPFPVSAPEVREALILRALGNDWRPTPKVLDHIARRQIAREARP